MSKQPILFGFLAEKKVPIVKNVITNYDRFVNKYWDICNHSDKKLAQEEANKQWHEVYKKDEDRLLEFLLKVSQSA